MKLIALMMIPLLSNCVSTSVNCPAWVEPIRADSTDDLDAAVAAAPGFSRSALTHNNTGEELGCW